MERKCCEDTTSEAASRRIVALMGAMSPTKEDKQGRHSSATRPCAMIACAALSERQLAVLAGSLLSRGQRSICGCLRSQHTEEHISMEAQRRDPSALATVG